MKTDKNLLIDISKLQKRNYESKLYLNHIKHYKASLEKIVQKVETPISLMFQIWKLQNQLLQIILNPIDKLKEINLMNEIHNFSKIRPKGSLDILNFGVIPYNFRHLRQQHLVEQLAKKGYRIFYIENYFIPIKKGGGYGSFQIKKHKENIYIVTLSSHNNIFIYHQIPTRKEIKSIKASLNNLIKKVKDTKAVAKIDYPFWGYLLPINIPIIYDCMDDYAGFKQTENHILVLEKELFKKSNLVLVCSNLLKEKFKKYLPKNTLLLKNAGEYDHFEKASHKTYNMPQELTNLPKPIIGYFGAIGEFIDVSLLKNLAKHFQKCSIVLIGDVRNQKVNSLSNTYHNIYTLGEKPYSFLPSYLQEFDVCIIPFVVNKSTRLIDPVKLYEYLASGKPVVASDISEIKEFNDVCYISKNNHEFIKNVGKALSENRESKIMIMKRRQVAKENTWEKRGNALNLAIQDLAKNRS